MKRDRSICTCANYYFPHPEWCEKHRPRWMCDCCKSPGVPRHSALDPEFDIVACDDCWLGIKKWQDTPADVRGRLTKDFKELCDKEIAPLIKTLDGIIHKL